MLGEEQCVRFRKATAKSRQCPFAIKCYIDARSLMGNYLVFYTTSKVNRVFIDSLSDSEINNVIKRSMLSNWNKNRLMVGSSVD